jgi:hypothetical protein
MLIDDNTPFEYISNHINLVGWPVVCLFFFWIARFISKATVEYKEDIKTIRETKELVDIKTDKALVLVAETKASVDQIVDNRLADIESKVDSHAKKSEKLAGILGSIKENTAVMAALLKSKRPKN